MSEKSLSYTEAVKGMLIALGANEEFDKQDVEFVEFSSHSENNITPLIAAEAIINYRVSRDEATERESEYVKGNRTEIYRQGVIVDERE